jgi:hypothetical protein
MKGRTLADQISSRDPTVGADPRPKPQPVDFSTPEGEIAIRAAIDLVLELRKKQIGPLSRKVALYERTFGLAVIPVVVRRAIRKLWRRGGKRGRSAG